MSTTIESLLSGLVRNPILVNLCRKVLLNIVQKDEERFHSINDKILSNKCESNDYPMLCSFLRSCGFQRIKTKPKNNVNNNESIFNDNNEYRWNWNSQLCDKTYLNNIILQLDRSIQMQQKQQENEIGLAYPNHIGTTNIRIFNAICCKDTFIFYTYFFANNNILLSF